MAKINDLLGWEGASSGPLLWPGWLSSSSTSTPHRNITLTWYKNHNVIKEQTDSNNETFKEENYEDPEESKTIQGDWDILVYF